MDVYDFGVFGVADDDVDDGSAIVTELGGVATVEVAPFPVSLNVKGQKKRNRHEKQLELMKM